MSGEFSYIKNSSSQPKTQFYSNTLPFERLAAAFKMAPDLTRRELDLWITAAAFSMQREIQLITPTKHGLLRGSIGTDIRPVGNFGVEAVIGTPLNYAVPVELGSKPHDIVAKNGKALHFMWRGIPIMAKRVRHPGTKGSFMFKRAYDANVAQIERDFESFVDHLFANITAGVR